MKLFECQHCGQLLYFDNTRCERCGLLLGYLPDLSILSALEWDERGWWRPLGAADRPSWFCGNAVHQACNWLVPAGGPQLFCAACVLNRTIPDLSMRENVVRWQRLEAGKHRLVYGLLRLRLPLVGRSEDPESGLAFDFLAGAGTGSLQPAEVVTGHTRGLITIDIAEADDAERERLRQDMAEPFRTLLGHFRHEVGHYYWDRLVRGGVWLSAFRTLFGDERQDYGLACAATTRQDRLRIGSRISSAAMPALIPGRTSPRPGRTTCISSMRWRQRTPSGCRCGRGRDAIRR